MPYLRCTLAPCQGVRCQCLAPTARLGTWLPAVVGSAKPGAGRLRAREGVSRRGLGLSSPALPASWPRRLTPLWGPSPIELLLSRLTLSALHTQDTSNTLRRPDLLLRASIPELLRLPPLASTQLSVAASCEPFDKDDPSFACILPHRDLHHFRFDPPVQSKTLCQPTQTPRVYPTIRSASCHHRFELAVN